MELDSSPEQRQGLIMQHNLTPYELAHQESLIQGREDEIREIESGVHSAGVWDIPQPRHAG